jgi:hypothetical protein
MHKSRGSNTALSENYEGEHTVVNGDERFVFKGTFSLNARYRMRWGDHDDGRELAAGEEQEFFSFTH